jgi:HK97 family phage major capsid protein
MSRQGDVEAAQRLAEHNRALSTGVAGAGVVPPQWLTDEFDALARQGRGLADAVRKINLGDNPSPITLPRQTTGTDSVVAQQATENTHPSETDAWATTTDVVTPKPFAGIQVVSRQMLDMGNPAVDELIYGDLVAAYNSKIEAAVGSALVTAAGAAVVTLASDATNFTATAAFDAVLDAAVAVRDQRKLPADLVAMGVVRYGKFLKLKDTANRPLIPAELAGPMNVVGVGQVNVDGRFTSAGLGVIASDGLSTGTYPDNIVVFRAADTILFEGNVQRFRFEEVAGPESVKLGIWCYAAVIVRQSGKSAKRIVVTAA